MPARAAGFGQPPETIAGTIESFFHAGVSNNEVKIIKGFREKVK